MPKNKLITDAGLAGLADLRSLDLMHNRWVTDAGVIGKPALTRVCFVFNQRLTDQAFEACRRLKSLHMGYNCNRKLTLEFVKQNKGLRELSFYHKRRFNRSWLAEGAQLVAPRAVFT